MLDGGREAQRRNQPARVATPSQCKVSDESKRRIEFVTSKSNRHTLKQALQNALRHSHSMFVERCSRGRKERREARGRAWQDES